jgi:uncharacterized protein (DUF2336 family)
MSAQEPSGKTKNTSGFRFQDIEELLCDPSPQRRCSGVRKLAQEINRGALAEGEWGWVQKALLTAADDVELRVRHTVAAEFAKSQHLPRDAAVALADDVMQVSHVVLEGSPTLTDEDLIRLLSDGKGPAQVSIARRPHVSCAVARAVVATRNAAAVTTLAANAGAELDDALSMAIIEGYGRYETVKTALVERGDLSAAVCARLASIVPPRLKASLLAKHELAEPLSGSVLETYSSAEECAVAVGPSRREAGDDSLSPSAVLRALCSGDIVFVEEAMAEISGLSVEKAGLLILDDGPFGLKAIYRKCGFPEEMFAAFRVGIDLIVETRQSGEFYSSEQFEQRAVERILARYRDLEVAELDYVLSKLSRYEAA